MCSYVGKIAREAVVGSLAIILAVLMTAAFAVASLLDELQED